MAKRNTNRRKAARATIDLLLANGCGVFTLFLASRQASYSQAQAAQHSLEALIAQRVRTLIAQADAQDTGAAPDAPLWESTGDTVVVPVTTESLIAQATARVVAALPRCATRSVDDFER